MFFFVPVQAWSLCPPKAHSVPPESLFFNKLSPASHAITSAENFHAGSFPAALKINSSWWPFVLCFVCRSFYTLSLHSWITAGPVNGTTCRERFKKKKKNYEWVLITFSWCCDLCPALKSCIVLLPETHCAVSVKSISFLFDSMGSKAI